MDLSKAFDMLPHNLIIQKLAKYGADDNTVSLIKDYLRDCKPLGYPSREEFPRDQSWGLYCSTYL